MKDTLHYVEGGVCAAKGFVANGLNCGLNPQYKTVSLVVVVYRLYSWFKSDFFVIRVSLKEHLSH